MVQNKREWIGTASMCVSTAFFVLCVCSISDSRLSILRSRQRIQLLNLGLTSIAPANLASAAKSFELSAVVEAQEFPTAEMTRLKAWKELQRELSAYAERLKILNAQGEELDRQLQQRTFWTSNLILASVIALIVLKVMNRRRMSKDSTHPCPK